MLAAVASRRWVFPQPPDSAAVQRLRAELRLPPVLCRLMAQRGMSEPEAVRGFLRPHAGQLHPPALLAGMGDAVARLRRARDAQETVLVHGDYDVDGICSTALYTRALRMMGLRALPFVPRRLVDGYDLSDAGIDEARKWGATLILTGDCGIVAHEAVERAAAAGIDVIVTDHHTAGPTLPAAAAVVNPNRRDCPYPEKGLAGVGVAYKVCCALAAELGFPEARLHSLLDLVAIATIADLAPLVGENRTLVRWGLKILPQTPNPGLRALLRVTKLDEKEITATQVGYVLAPRINAVGRMGEAMGGVRLLLTDDEREAAAIAASLEEANRLRQSVDGDTLRAALTKLETEYDEGRDRGVVLAADGWHPGVIGIVASRVVERIHRPTVMIALDGAHDGKGSARSIPGFHLYDAMLGCSEHLTRFGGHRMAAGCSIRPDRVEPFRAAFDGHARSVLEDDHLVPEVRVDLEVELHQADEELARMIRHAGPFGMGNATPVFAARGVTLVGSPKVVGQNHLKMTLGAFGHSLDAIGFGMAARLEEPGFAAGPLDVAFKLEENTWNGRTRPQAKLVDVRPANCRGQGTGDRG
ncbi:MAG: single-stranded-DNA-specific exonuclease RecJ [Gemmatimonadetes bacterium]|nr:single-stranded-DNA-specific exonuclease RecJ [Gemmatimonadota bacterium]